MGELIFNLKRLEKILSSLKTDEEGRMLLPKKDLEILRMGNKKLFGKIGDHNKLITQN